MVSREDAYLSSFHKGYYQMSDDLKLFEKRLTRELESFKEHGRVIERRRALPSRSPIRGMEVKLCVRAKQFSFLDEEYVTVVDTISKVEARLVAEQRARDAGWPIVGHLKEMTQLV